MPLGLASFSLPFCTNVIVTLLIIGRIWYMSRRMQTYSLTNTRGVMAIMLESGVLYFVVQFVFLILYGVNNPGEQVIIPMAVQVYVRLSFSGTVERDLRMHHTFRASHLSSSSYRPVWASLPSISRKLVTTNPLLTLGGDFY